MYSTEAATIVALLPLSFHPEPLSCFVRVTWKTFPCSFPGVSEAFLGLASRSRAWIMKDAFLPAVARNKAVPDKVAFEPRAGPAATSTRNGLPDTSRPLTRTTQNAQNFGTDVNTVTE